MDFEEADTAGFCVNRSSELSIGETGRVILDGDFDSGNLFRREQETPIVQAAWPRAWWRGRGYFVLAPGLEPEGLVFKMPGEAMCVSRAKTLNYLSSCVHKRTFQR